MVPKSARWHTGQALKELVGEGTRKVLAASLSLGVSDTTIYRWMEQEEWPMRTVSLVAAAFGVSERWLMTGEGEKFVGPSGLAGGEEDAAVELLYLRLEGRLKTLLRQYTREVAKASRGDDDETPPASKGKRRQRGWTTRESRDV